MLKQQRMIASSKNNVDKILKLQKTGSWIVFNSVKENLKTLNYWRYLVCTFLKIYWLPIFTRNIKKYPTDNESHNYNTRLKKRSFNITALKIKKSSYM